MKLKIASEMGIKLKSKIARGPNPLANRKRKLREHQIVQLQKNKYNKTLNSNTNYNQVNKVN